MKTRVLLIGFLLILTVGTVHNCRQVDAYEKGMAECIKWAEVNVPNVDPRAWCEP